MAGYFAGRLDDVRDLLDHGLLAIIERASAITGTELAHVLQQRNGYFTGMRQFMEDFDLLLTPTMPDTAFTAGLDEPDGWSARRSRRWIGHRSPSPSTSPGSQPQRCRAVSTMTGCRSGSRSWGAGETTVRSCGRRRVRGGAALGGGEAAGWVTWTSPQPVESSPLLNDPHPNPVPSPSPVAMGEGLYSGPLAGCGVGRMRRLPRLRRVRRSGGGWRWQSSIAVGGCSTTLGGVRPGSVLSRQEVRSKVAWGSSAERRPPATTA